jgi:hypothetical protein
MTMKNGKNTVTVYFIALLTVCQPNLLLNLPSMKIFVLLNVQLGGLVDMICLKMICDKHGMGNPY